MGTSLCQPPLRSGVDGFRPILSCMTDPRRHLSMLRSYTVADALTIGNASCGTIAIFLCLDYLASGNPRLLWYAFILLPAALVCDVLDGLVARTFKGRQSVLGGDLVLSSVGLPPGSGVATAATSDGTTVACRSDGDRVLFDAITLAPGSALTLTVPGLSLLGLPDLGSL